MIALIRELWNDRNGDAKKDKDFIWRTFWVLVEAGIHYFVFNKSILVSIALPCAVFISLFDYLIAYILIKRGKIENPNAHWFYTLSTKKDYDKKLKKINPWVLFIARFLILTLTIYFYGTD